MEPPPTQTASTHGVKIAARDAREDRGRNGKLLFAQIFRAADWRSFKRRNLHVNAGRCKGIRGRQGESSARKKNAWITLQFQRSVRAVLHFGRAGLQRAVYLIEKTERKRRVQRAAKNNEDDGKKENVPEGQTEADGHDQQ